MVNKFVSRPRSGMFSQLGRYKAEVADLESATALQTTTLRVAIAVAELLNEEETASLGSPIARKRGEGCYEHLVHRSWSLVVYRQLSNADLVARSRDPELAARAARLMQAHTPEPPKAKRRWRPPDRTVARGY
jgi:hypothetical protein